MKFLGHILVHVTGFLVTTMVLWLISSGLSASLVSDHVFNVAILALENEEFSSFAAQDLLMFLCLSGFTWSLLYGCSVLFRMRRVPMGNLKRAHGTTITETLIALPVLLMLIFGLVQMSLNYIAAILLDYGTFQAARTMWVWEPEATGGRANVTIGLAQEMAKIQAALAVTPAAAGDYRQNYFTGTDEFKDARAMLLAAQLPYFATDMGAHAKLIVNAIQLEDPTGLVEDEKSMWRSLGTSSFRLRSVRNFSFAYASTSVEPLVTGNQVGAKVIYNHFIAMPFIGRIFGSYGATSGRPGFYASMIREFTLERQYPANSEFP